VSAIHEFNPLAIVECEKIAAYGRQSRSVCDNCQRQKMLQTKR
jgi:hypothetical protein